MALPTVPANGTNGGNDPSPHLELLRRHNPQIANRRKDSLSSRSHHSSHCSDSSRSCSMEPRESQGALARRPTLPQPPATPRQQSLPSDNGRNDSASVESVLLAALEFAADVDVATERCPWCARKFSLSAFERHEPICSKLHNKTAALRLAPTPCLTPNRALNRCGRAILAAPRCAAVYGM
eukprot:TRINITY_DN38836_c0_g1_i1.p1 TRINITY_DN38836_c0_g1~~TRINITY_DN38836_c0_g1_i1.p1  ORF type:complete len:181 (+),score=25.68 TRINITY_DN38836_c0_g1_i1:66-608(+)